MDKIKCLKIRKEKDYFTIGYFINGIKIGTDAYKLKSSVTTVTKPLVNEGWLHI